MQQNRFSVIVISKIFPIYFTKMTSENSSNLKLNAKNLFNCEKNLLSYVVKSNVNLETKKDNE